MKKYIILFLVWTSELLALIPWHRCWLFTDDFYVSLSKVESEVIYRLNTTSDMPLFIAKIFHNKVFAFLWDSIQVLLTYWDVRFLVELLGFAGAFGVYLTVWHVITRKEKRLIIYIVIGVVLLLEAIEIFVQPYVDYHYRVIAIGLSLHVFSLIGLSQWLDKITKRKLLIVVLLISLTLISVYLLPMSLRQFCLKI